MLKSPNDPWTPPLSHPRSARLQNDVAADLIDAAVAKLFAEQLDQLRAAEVAGEFHAMASNSSRTRCRRIAVGPGRSKKKAAVTSRKTFGEEPAIRFLSHAENKFHGTKYG